MVDYYSIKDTLKYVKHLIENTKNTEILDFVIVDNAEEDVSWKILRSKYEVNKKNFLKYRGRNIPIRSFDFMERKVYYLQAKANLGYARGNNLGVIFSEIYLKNKYLVISNNDLMVLNGSLSWRYFIELFEKYTDCAVIGPAIMDTEGRNQSPRGYQNAGKYLFLNYWNILLCGWLNHYLKFIMDCQKGNRVYWVSGCFMVIDARKFIESGMFDEKTFLFAEEMILSERLLKKGYHTLYTPDVKLLHNHSVTVKKKFSKLQMERINFEAVLYYFIEYRHLGKVVSVLAQIHFGLFCMLYTIRKIPQKMYHVWKDKL